MRHSPEVEAQIAQDLKDNPDLRRYDCDEYTVLMPEKHCVFCKHCTDIFYDWNGPYLFVCKLGNGDYEDCEHFDEDA